MVNTGEVSEWKSGLPCQFSSREPEISIGKKNREDDKWFSWKAKKEWKSEKKINANQKRFMEKRVW